LPWREVTERGGRGGGGFDSSAVDGELWHRSGQKAMGSGGASCAARSEEKRGMGKRKRAMAVLNAFVSATVAWSSGGGPRGSGTGGAGIRWRVRGRGLGGALAGEEGAVREGGGGVWSTVALGCWAVYYSPGPVNSAFFDFFQKKNQTNLNLIRSKDGLPEVKIFK
jgi:hypothetical protein